MIDRAAPAPRMTRKAGAAVRLQFSRQEEMMWEDFGSAFKLHHYFFSIYKD